MRRSRGQVVALCFLYANDRTRIVPLFSTLPHDPETVRYAASTPEDKQ